MSELHSLSIVILLCSLMVVNLLAPKQSRWTQVAGTVEMLLAMGYTMLWEYIAKG